MVNWFRRPKLLTPPDKQPAVQAQILRPYPGKSFGESLLDAAAWRIRWLGDYTWRGVYEAPPELPVQFPDATAEEISDAEKKASALLGAAYFSADYDGDGRGIAFLKRTFPGFSDETYSMVYGYGRWLSR